MMHMHDASSVTILAQVFELSQTSSDFSRCLCSAIGLVQWTRIARRNVAASPSEPGTASILVELIETLLLVQVHRPLTDRASVLQELVETLLVGPWPV